MLVVYFKSPKEETADVFIANTDNEEKAIKLAKKEEQEYQSLKKADDADWDIDENYTFEKLGFDFLLKVIKQIQNKEIYADDNKNIISLS